MALKQIIAALTFIGAVTGMLPIDPFLHIL